MADPAADEPEITLSDSAMENGLAIMLSSLIRQNIADKPEKLADLKRLCIDVGIEAYDIDVKLTMSFSGGGLVFHNGIRENAQVLIVADSDSILNLSLISIRFGLPWLFDKNGMEFARKFLSGSLKIKGMATNPMALVRLTRLVSVT